jgi:hypothetical protein
MRKLPIGESRAKRAPRARGRPRYPAGFSLVELMAVFAIPVQGRRGWISLIVVVLFFGSANLFASGIAGIYVAQLSDEIKAWSENLVGDELR